MNVMMKAGTKVERRIDDLWFPAIVLSISSNHSSKVQDTKMINDHDTLFITIKYLDDGKIEKDIIFLNKNVAHSFHQLRIIEDQESEMLNEKLKRLQDMQITMKQQISICNRNIYPDESLEEFEKESAENGEPQTIFHHGNHFNGSQPNTKYRTEPSNHSERLPNRKEDESIDQTLDSTYPAGNGINALRFLKH